MIIFNERSKKSLSTFIIEIYKDVMMKLKNNNLKI